MSSVKKGTVHTTNKKRRTPYIEVLLVVFVLILFLTAHYLSIIYREEGTYKIWMAIRFDAFIVDFVFYFAIFLTVILFILILHRNFIVRGKK